MICTRCGKSFERSHRGGHNVLYCASCRPIVKKEGRARLKAGIYLPTRPKIKVLYPGVALPDYWTKNEYERYKDVLPEGTVIL